MNLLAQVGSSATNFMGIAEQASGRSRVNSEAILSNFTEACLITAKFAAAATSIRRSSAETIQWMGWLHSFRVVFGHLLI